MLLLGIAYLVLTQKVLKDCLLKRTATVVGVSQLQKLFFIFTSTSGMLSASIFLQRALVQIARRVQRRLLRLISLAFRHSGEKKDKW